MTTSEPKKLIDRIAQGDWFTKDNHQVFANLNGVEYVIAFCYDAGAANGDTNAELIAMAPKLLRENEQLREALKEVVNQLTTLRSEYYRQGVTLTNEQVNMGSAALLQAKAALAGEK